MLNYRFFPAIIFVAFFTICCSNEKRQLINSSIIRIDLNKLENVSISDIYTKIEIIRLQTRSDILIGKAGKFVLSNNKFFVLDWDQKCIMIFDGNGRYIKKVGKCGNGPGEYRDISDFEINQFDNNIEVLTPQGIIYVYDNEGNFLERVVIPINGKGVHYFKYIDKDVIALYSKSEQKNIMLFSKGRSEIIGTFFETPSVARHSPLQTSRSPFSSFNDKLIFYQGFTNSVYEIDKDGIELRYSWDFYPNNIDVEKLPSGLSIPEFARFLLSGSFVHSYISNMENSRFIVTKFRFGSSWVDLIYDKKLGNYKVFSRFKEQLYPPFNSVVVNDGILALVDPVDLGKYVKPEILDSLNAEELQKICVSDNSIILHYVFNTKQ